LVDIECTGGQPGYELTEPYSTTGGSATVTPAAGEVIACTFTNAQRGPVDVVKDAGTVTRNGNVYTVTYDIVVSTTSQVAEPFTLSDTPAFAPGTTIQSMTVTGPGIVGTLD